jgi:hypothetical protein
MEGLIKKFDTLNGAKFITVKGYVNGQGEIADHNINVNVDIQKAKETDLETLLNFNMKDTLAIAEKVETDVETVQKAVAELVVSAEKNLSDNPTNQSKGQTDAYVGISNGLRLHKDNLALNVYGFANSKTVIVEGTPKAKPNSSAKTLAKNAIRRNLKMAKFRSLNLKNADSLTITGGTIQVS